MDRQMGRQWKKKERENERPALLAAFLFSSFFPFFSTNSNSFFQKTQELSFQYANDRKIPSFLAEKVI